MDGLLNRVGRIALRAVDMRDRVANRAGDACFCGGMILHVEIWIIKGPAHEWNHIMAPGAPSRRLDVAIALHEVVAQLLD